MLLGIGKEHNAKKELCKLERIRRSQFGLGTKRTLQQAVQFITDINLQEKKMVKNKCSNLIWVSFVESPNYGVNEYLDSRSLTGRYRQVSDDYRASASHERKSVASSNDLSGIQSVRVISSVVLTVTIVFSFFKRQSRRRKGVN